MSGRATAACRPPSSRPRTSAGRATVSSALVAEQAGETIVVDDVAAGPVPLPTARREGLATLLGVPLKAQGRLLAVLVPGARARAARYSADDIYFATAAGAQLAAAIERALLFRAAAAAHRARAPAARGRGDREPQPRLAVAARASSSPRPRACMGAQRSALLVVQRRDAAWPRRSTTSATTTGGSSSCPLDGLAVGPRRSSTAETVAVSDVDDGAAGRRRAGARWRLPQLPHRPAAELQGHLRRAHRVLRRRARASPTTTRCCCAPSPCRRRSLSTTAA